MKTVKITKEQKGAMRTAEKFWEKFSIEVSPQMAKWALNRILAGQTEKQKLLKEKARIEARLEEIKKEI